MLNQQNEGVNMHTNQIVIRFDPKQLSEVAKGQRCICFQTEIREVMGWCEVAALTVGNVKGRRMMP